METASCDIGLIGLAVMGQNLVLNMNDHGYRVAVFNRTVSKVDDFLNNEAKGTQGRRRAFDRGAGRGAEEAAPRDADGQGRRDRGRDDRAACCRTSKRATSSSTAATRIIRTPTAAPRPLRTRAFSSSAPAFRAAKKARAIGPSIMPGGNPAAWPHVKEIFQAIAAKVEDGTPCCDWVGENGAGHYVKMVHNGIEYGDMQLICEAYQLLKDGLGLTADELHEVFAEWNKGELDSYLIEITRADLRQEGRRRHAAGRQDSRHRRPEGHRQVDRHQRARSGHAGHADRRSRIRALPLGDEGRARGGVQDSERAEARSGRRIARRSSKTCGGRSTARRSSPTRRATCCCARRRRRRSGI